MDKRISMRLMVKGIIFALIFYIFASLSHDMAYAGMNVESDNYKFFITSDIHYFSTALYDDSETFINYMNSGDGKMVDYSDEIIGAFTRDAIDQKPSAVIISGDLTFNGEKKSHEDLAEILKKIKGAGTDVLVIPGNHDINNIYAREVKSSGFSKTDYVSPEQFMEIYGEYGYNDAVSRDENSLSYISKLTDGLYALMLDTCMYYTNVENNTSYTGGRIQEETMEWIQEVIGSVKAEDEDAVIITVMHHNLFVHNRNFEFNYIVYSATRVQKQLAEIGLELFFSGHIHIQDILTKDLGDRVMTEIVSSALTAYPISYGIAEFDGNAMDYYTQWVDMEAYAQAEGIDDENLLNFEQYSWERFNERSAKRIEQALRESDFPKEDIEAAVSTVKKMNTYYFAGNIDLVADEILSSRGYEILSATDMFNDYMKSIFEDGRGENNMVRIIFNEESN